MRTDGFSQVLARWGGSAEVVRGGVSRPVRGFVQPRRKPEQPEWEAGPLGRADQRQWLYLGQGPLETGDTVLWQEEAYTVCRAEPVYAGSVLSHWWAVLKRKREEAV